MWGYLNICKSLIIIQHINRSKDKNHMFTSTDAGKVFDKLQHPVMIKGIEGIYLNMINAIYDKSIVNIILNGEKLKPFPLNQEQGKSVYSLHSYSS
jgi:energy-converting hydrogenase Eha subunit F